MVKTSRQRYDVSSHGQQARQGCVERAVYCLLGEKQRKKQILLCKERTSGIMTSKE